MRCPSQSSSPLAPWNQEEEPALYVDACGRICQTVFYDLQGHPFADQHLTIPASAVYSDTVADAVIAFYDDRRCLVEINKVESVDGKVMCEIVFPHDRVVNISIENIFSPEGIKEYLLPP